MSNTPHVPLLFHKVNILALQTRIIDISCDILFFLGVIGNLLGLFIFTTSRRSWRISSVYTYLASYSSITNMLCLIRYASILHSTSREILSESVGKIWWACKFYEFSFSFRVISSWITLFWMLERFICLSIRLRRFFHQWHSLKLTVLIPVMIIILILGCVIGPPVYMFQPQTFENDTTTKISCGIHPNGSLHWQKYFNDIHFGLNHFTIRCLFSELIPTGTIIFLNSYIIHHLIRTCRRLHRTNRFRTQKSLATSWMNIILILHSLLFLASLFSHIMGHWMNLDAHETWWVSLAILVNCSFNFYLYCLSGKAFRNEICRFFQRCQRQRKRKVLRKRERQQYYHRVKNYNFAYEQRTF